MSFELEENKPTQNQFRSRIVFGQMERPKMIEVMLKTGLIKDEKVAGNTLLIGASVIFIASIFMFIYVFKDPEPIPLLDMQAIVNEAKAQR